MEKSCLRHWWLYRFGWFSREYWTLHHAQWTLGKVPGYIRISLSLFFFCLSAAYGIPGPGIRSELQLQPTWQLWQCWTLNPLCWLARDPGIEPASQHCREVDLVVPWGELQESLSVLLREDVWGQLHPCVIHLLRALGQVAECWLPAFDSCWQVPLAQLAVL